MKKIPEILMGIIVLFFAGAATATESTGPKSLAALIADHKLMSSDDAVRLVAEFTSGGEIRRQGGHDVTLIPGIVGGSPNGPFFVVVCNFDKVRAEVDLDPKRPRNVGIERGCAPVTGVIGLGAVGARKAGDGNDNGASGPIDWSGVFLYRPAETHIWSVLK